MFRDNTKIKSLENFTAVIKLQRYFNSKHYELASRERMILTCRGVLMRAAADEG
jgi:hypothetical protein